MASKVWPKVVGGCAIGCALVVFVIVAAGIGGWRLVKGTVDSMQAAVETQQRLDERFGDPRDWVPPLDGAVAPDRMEAFLQVRERLTEPRRELAALLAALDAPEGDQTLPGAIRALEAGASIGPTVGEYLAARDRALLEVGMGLGEWTWIDVLAYHAWLGEPLTPPTAPRSGDGRVQVHVGGDLSAEGSVRQARGDLYMMMRNLRDALETGGVVDPEWRDAIEEEMAKLRDDPSRLPWQDGLPERIAASFEPYRERLQTSWAPRTAVFDLVRVGPHGIHIDD
jgi:hypothetical protein